MASLVEHEDRAVDLVSGSRLRPLSFILANSVPRVPDGTKLQELQEVMNLMGIKGYKGKKQASLYNI